MSLLYKKCEECGTKINKINIIWDIFNLKSGRLIICQKCGSKYNTLKIIQLFGKPYNWFIVWMLSILLIVRFIDSFNLNLGIEIWFYSIIIYIILEYLVMSLLPLKRLNDI